MRNGFKIPVEKLEGKKPLGRSRQRREDNSRINLREVGLDGVDWIGLALTNDGWQAFEDAVMNLAVA